MKQEVFQARRKEFLQKIGADSIAILFSSPHQKRNDDVHYEYRTCSYFYYLTGVQEQEAAAIFLPNSDQPYHLFVMPKNPEMEMWEGKRVGVDAAKNMFLADATHSIEDLEKVFRELLKQASTLYHNLGSFPEQDEFIFRVLKDHQPNRRRGEKEFHALKKVQDILSPMRKVKSAEELDVIRKSCKNAAAAHRKAMEFTRPEMYEYQVEAAIEFWFRYGGAEDVAYSSIVAAGNNATVLHYKTNRDLMRDGELLLIDAGGEMGLYASDITRTFPVNGKFSKEQRELYEIVLESQKASILAVKPGVKFVDVHMAAVRVLVEGLVRLGLLQGAVEDLIKDRKNYASFYPHNTSHWIGLDVHDTGDYFLADGSSIPLEEGNILTIEPGLYISEDRTDVPAGYRGIGIRIEDDVLVTASGHEVLTADAPKEVAEIEAIVGTQKLAY